MMQIQWQDGVRIHVGCGGEVEIITDGYTSARPAASQSFSDILSDEERERQKQEDEEARARERDEYERSEWERG
jgi:hypothetical protein